MALVPYVPPISYDNPAMIGRIKEIDVEDAVGYASADNGKLIFRFLIENFWISSVGNVGLRYCFVIFISRFCYFSG